jgi:hypothetical protein
MEGFSSRRAEEDPQKRAAGSDETPFPWLRGAIDARAAANIRAWREYLPSDCIEIMIALGWDQDT